MASESIITATFGVPGSGKTYSRVRFLVDDFLINNKSGLYITNIPLNVDTISDYVSKRLFVSVQDIRDRIVIIPDDITIYWEKLNQVDNKELQSFTSDTFPPSAFLQQYNLENSHIAIDEFHKYFSKKGPKYLRKLWNDWFAEIRKTGCTFEAITQSYGQMSEEFLDKCATRLELINHADLRDPFFKIRMGDWYELRAGLLGKLSLQRVSERETRRGSTDSGRITWQPTGKHQTYTLDPFYFQFYDSFHNSTGSSGVRSTPADLYGRRIIFWFLRRHFFSLFSRFVFVFLLYWFLLCGGFTWTFQHLMRTMALAAASNNPNIKVAGTVTGVNPAAHEQRSDHSSSSKLSEKESQNIPKIPDLSGFYPVCFYNSSVYLRNGMVLKDGQIFKSGYFKGKKIKIDFSGRSYTVDEHFFGMFSSPADPPGGSVSPSI